MKSWFGHDGVCVIERPCKIVTVQVVLLNEVLMISEDDVLSK